jgi:hypothetical protein
MLLVKKSVAGENEIFPLSHMPFMVLESTGKDKTDVFHEYYSEY